MRRAADGSDHVISASCVVGRADPSQLVIDDQFASQTHARIAWTGSRWTIRDLGSSNGTFVNGKRLEPGTPKLLTVGMKIGFGGAEGWELVEDGAPGPTAVDAQSGEIRAGRADLLLLPDESEPLLSIYYDASAAGWMCDHEDASFEVKDALSRRGGAAGPSSSRRRWSPPRWSTCRCASTT